MKPVAYPEIVTRLKRAERHLRSLIEIFGVGQECMDLAQQLHAVENALASAKRELIHTHVEHSLKDAILDGSMKPDVVLQELKALRRYL